MNKRQRQAYANKRSQGKLRRAYDERRDYNYTSDTDSRLINGELVEAAAIMLQHAAIREKTRNLTKSVEAYESIKRGRWIDPDVGSYGNVEGIPPANWPLTPDEWQHFNQEQLLTKAMTLIAHELERLEGLNADIHRHGAVALDREQLEQIKKSKELADRKIRQQWNRTKKEAILAIDPLVGIGVPGSVTHNAVLNGVGVPFAGTSYANALIDDLLEN